MKGISKYNSNGTCEKIDGDYLKRSVRSDAEIGAIFEDYFTGRREGYLKVLTDLKCCSKICRFLLFRLHFRTFESVYVMHWSAASGFTNMK